jgi:hypothetical protein
MKTFLCLLGPPLCSGGQSSSLQIQRSGFDFRHYQIFREVVGLERGPLLDCTVTFSSSRQE